MNLGENIYRLRTERNLSQGELADAMEVSRQSVSKWENNSAVPELDKLMKIADIFEISLDTLVGNTPAQKQGAYIAKGSLPNLPPDPPESSGSVAGWILLVVAAALCILLSLQSTILAGIIFTAPLFICSALCFILKRRKALWCLWVLLFSAVTWCFGGTGLGLIPFWQMLNANVLFQFPTSLYNALTALAINVFIAAMGFWTYRSYLSAAIRHVAARPSRLFLGWLLTFIPSILQSYFSSLGTRTQILSGYHTGINLYRWISYGLSWLHFIAVLIMVIFTIARFRHLQMRTSMD